MLEELTKLRKIFPNDSFGIYHNLFYNGARVCNSFTLSFRKYLENDIECPNLEFLRKNVNKLINEYKK